MRPSHIPNGYRMITDVQIEGYKGFKHSSLHDCRRLNVIVGPNGTGKTSILEAIFLAAAQNADAVVRMRQWRGRDAQFQGNAAHIYSGIFEGFFWRPRGQEPCVINLRSTTGEQRVLRVSRLAEGSSTLTPLGLSQAPPEVEFTWSGPRGEIKRIPRFSSSGALDFGPPANDPLDAHFVAARIPLSGAETAVMLSQLRLASEDAAVSDALIREFPIIDSISVEAPYGPPETFGRMSQGQRKLLPLSEISGGISHLAGILVRLASAKNGVLLVDEIENGFYHERYEAIWRTLFSVAERSNAQVFATTHSLECIQALADAMSGSSEEVGFYRARLHDGEPTIKRISSETIFATASAGEVR